MCYKIKLTILFGFILLGQGCIQNGVHRCNCVNKQRACRQCYSNLNHKISYQQKLYHSPLYEAPSSEKLLLPPLQSPTSLSIKETEYQPTNIYLHSPTSVQQIKVKEGNAISSLYPAEEYEQIIYEPENYLQQQLQPHSSQKINPTATPPLLFHSSQNSITESNSISDPKNTSEQIPVQENFKHEAAGVPVAPASYPIYPPSPHPDPCGSPCSQRNDDYLVKKIVGEMSKKSAAALPLSFIGPTVSAAGLAVGLINYFRANPVIPQLEQLREDVIARFDKIDQEIAANRGVQAVQSDFFSEVEVKMNSLRKHHELYMTEANQVQTDAFKSICMDPAYNPVTLFGAAESFLSFKKMDLQLENDGYSDESYEKIKSLYRNIYDELVLLYGYCEAVVNGPGDEARTAKRTTIAENMVKNVNVLLEDLNQRRLLNLNTLNDNSTVVDNV